MFVKNAFLVATTLLIIASHATAQGVYSEKIAIGKKLPGLNLTLLDGSPLSTDSLIGKSLVINFWSVTCRPCIGEIPDLNRLKENYKDVVFIAVAPEAGAKVQIVLAKTPFNFLIAANAKDIFNSLGITSFPLTLFIDKKGIVRNLASGAPLRKDEKTGKFTSMAFEHYKFFVERIR